MIGFIVGSLIAAVAYVMGAYDGAEIAKERKKSVEDGAREYAQLIYKAWKEYGYGYESENTDKQTQKIATGQRCYICQHRHGKQRSVRCVHCQRFGRRHCGA